MAPRLALPGLVARAPALGAVTWRYFCHGDPGGELDPLAIPGSLLGCDRLFRLGNDTVLAVGPSLFPCPGLAGLVGACAHTASTVSDCGRCGVVTRLAAGFGERSGRGDHRIAIGPIEVEVP